MLQGKGYTGGPGQCGGAYARPDSPAERPKGGRNRQSYRGETQMDWCPQYDSTMAFLVGRCQGPNFKLNTASSVAVSVGICVRVHGGQVT